VIDLTEEQNENKYDLMCGNSESVSNDIDESELEFEKQGTERI
jgi:hypothetical protein